MAIQISRESAPTVALFYPGNSLMHQVSNWAGEHPACQFQLHFPESLREIGTLLRGSTISIVDVTEDPVQASPVFLQLMAESQPGSVAVYTETMHEGLELFVRTRGALLLLGPMSDAAWEGLFEAMRRCLARKARFRFPTRQPAEVDAGLATAWLQESRLKNSLTNRFRKTA